MSLVVGGRPHRRDAALSALFHDEPTIEAMNLLGLDLDAVGNHEFDEGADELLRMQRRLPPGRRLRDGDGFDGAEFQSSRRTSSASDRRDAVSALRDPELPGRADRLHRPDARGHAELVTPAGGPASTFQDEAETVNALVPS